MSKRKKSNGKEVVKSVLYVDKNPGRYSGRISDDVRSMEDFIFRELNCMRRYRVEMVYDLNSNSVDEALKNGEFDVMMTHVPYDGTPDYQISLGRIRRLIEFHLGIKVIAYTGASESSLSDKNLREIGVVGIVRKRDYGKKEDKQVDLVKIKKCLEKVLGG